MSDARFLGTLWRNLIAGWHTLMFCDEPLSHNLLTVKKKRPGRAAQGNEPTP